MREIGEDIAALKLMLLGNLINFRVNVFHIKNFRICSIKMNRILKDI